MDKHKEFTNNSHHETKLESYTQKFLVVLTVLMALSFANFAHAVRASTEELGEMFSYGLSRGLSQEQVSKKVNQVLQARGTIDDFKKLCNEAQSSVPLMSAAAAARVQDLRGVANATSQALDASCIRPVTTGDARRCRFGGAPLGQPVGYATNPETYVSSRRSIGKGYCVDIVQSAVPEVGSTKQWIRGYSLEEIAKSGDPSQMKIGTPIAIFNAAGGTRYTGTGNGVNHAGIFNGYVRNVSGEITGFKIIHQYQQQINRNGKTVTVRKPPFIEEFTWNDSTKKPYKQASAYHTIQIENSPRMASR
jgi:hypothetical protein